MTPNIVILAFVTIERLGELLLARHNTTQLLAKGAKEFAPKHYTLIVALHGAWLAILWLQALPRAVQPFWLALFLLIELVRFWVLTTLGQRWTTRIIVLPKAPLVSRGPYRFIRHPNYVVVIAEILILPLVFSLWGIALVFSVLNGVVIAIRIRAEDRALGRFQDVSKSTF